MTQRKKKQLIITLLLFIVSLILFVYSRNKVNNQDIEYEEVQVTVISARTEKERFPWAISSHYAYNVEVEYEGEKYDLINVKSGEIIRYEALANLDEQNQYNNPFFDNTVYFSNGKMYSNLDGIRTESKDFNWQMVGLAGIAVFGTVHLMCVADAVDKKRKKLL